MFGIPDIISGVASVVDKFISSDEDKTKVNEVLGQAKLDLEKAFVEAQAASVQADANGESWLQRNWRPVTMLSFNAVILFHVVVLPLLRIKYTIPDMPFPNELWVILGSGISGYGVLRSAEKSILPSIGALIEKLKK